MKNANIIEFVCVISYDLYVPTPLDH